MKPWDSARALQVCGENDVPLGELNTRFCPKEVFL